MASISQLNIDGVMTDLRDSHIYSEITHGQGAYILKKALKYFGLDDGKLHSMLVYIDNINTDKYDLAIITWNGISNTATWVELYKNGISLYESNGLGTLSLKGFDKDESNNDLNYDVCWTILA